MMVDTKKCLPSFFMLEKCTSEYLLGRIAAISLRIYNITGDEAYYYNAIKYYIENIM